MSDRFDYCTDPPSVCARCARKIINSAQFRDDRGLAVGYCRHGQGLATAKFRRGESPHWKIEGPFTPVQAREVAAAACGGFKFEA